MNLSLHPQHVIRKLTIGREGAPLLVIDNLIAEPDTLVEIAASKYYGDVASYYPGIRSKVPLSYQQFVLQHLHAEFVEYFGLQGSTLRFTSCHFSLVTTPPEKLTHLQRIPHIDSLNGRELAFVHYLFRRDLGGTAFYRHRSTGFEFVDEARQDAYFAQVELENSGPHKPAASYINGSTELYEQVGKQEGLFNRMLVYRRTSLHSASLAADFTRDPNPLTGRLSVNGFLASTQARGQIG